MPARRLLDRADHAARARRPRPAARWRCCSGASSRASSIVNCEPYQNAPFLWPISSTPSSSMPVTISSIIRRCSACCCQSAAGQLVHRHHRGVAGVVGVVHGRPVDHGIAVAQRQIVRDRDRLVVGDQEAVERPVVAASRCARACRPRAGSGRSPRRSRWRGACRPRESDAHACPSRARPAGSPRETKPSIDQVLTNSPGAWGLPTWVSRSAMWIALTPRSRNSRAQPAGRSAPRAAGRCRGRRSAPPP